MSSPDIQSERQQLEKAIAVQENLRGTVDDAIIDATIATLREKLAALEPSPQEQRKLATILFIDIAGHTALTMDLDPEEQMALVDPILARFAEKVEYFGGHIARYQGDGFKAVFGLPLAHENDPQQAVRAGLAIQEEAASVAAELMATRGFPEFRVRVGIATGLVFAGGETEGEDTIKGAPVNLAARLESLAEPGMVLVSQETQKLTRGLFDFESSGPMMVKGFAEPVFVYRILRARQRGFYRRARGIEGIETRMIGREAEFIQLQKALADVIEEQDRQLVTIIGEAGIGKSRLLFEFENWVDQDAQSLQLYKGRARLETQGQPYGLLRNLFVTQFNIQDDDPGQIAREKLTRGIAVDAALERDSERKAPILGQLLGYDFSDSPQLENVLNAPRQLRDQALGLIDRYFRAVSKQNPVLVLLEDLHWADDASLDTLIHLAGDWVGVPVFILATSRPNLLERRPNWGEGQEFQRSLDLVPLSKRESRHLVEEVLQKVSDLPERVSKLIVSNSEGNPFYVEELVKLLIEDGVIVPGETSWQVQTTQLADVHVPATLTGVLQARLDGLPPEERDMLQAASVIGRVFWDAILGHIYASTEKDTAALQVAALLDHLRNREFIFHRETSAFADAREHIFKHALLREVTYESVLKRVRQTYHGLVADWLLEHTADRTGEFMSQIAEHLELAGREADAIHYLKQAGEGASNRYAREEAVRHYRRALDLIAGQPEPEGRSQKLELLLDLAGAYYSLALDQPAFASQSLQHYEEAYALARELGDKRGTIRALLPTQWFPDYFPTYWEQMRANLQEALRLSQELEDEALIGHTMIALSSRGEVTIEQAEASIERLEKEQNLPLLQEAYFPLIWLHLGEGNFERAIECCDRSIELAALLGSPPVMYPTFKGRALTLLGRYGLAWEALQAEVTGKDHPFGKAFQGLGLGWYYYYLGAYDKALSAFEQAGEGMKQVGRPWFRLDALSGQALSHIGTETLTEDLLSRLEAEVRSFDLEFRAVILSEAQLSFGRPEKARRLAQRAQKQEMDREIGFQILHYVDGLLLECRALRRLNQPEALLDRANEGLRIAGEKAYKPAAWKFNGLKGWALDQLRNKKEAERAYQAAAAGIRELAEEINDPALREKFLYGRPAAQILARDWRLRF